MARWAGDFVDANGCELGRGRGHSPPDGVALNTAVHGDSSCSRPSGTFIAPGQSGEPSAEEPLVGGGHLLFAGGPFRNSFFVTRARRAVIARIGVKKEDSQSQIGNEL